MPDRPAEPADPSAPDRPPDSQAARPPALATGPRLTVVWLLAGACVVMGALVVHQQLARRAPGRPAADELDTAWRTPTTPEIPQTSPADFVRQPLAGIGMEILRVEPPDAVVPEGAVRQTAHRRFLPDGAEDGLRYTVALDLPALETFYRDALAKAGFQFLTSAPTMSGDGVSLVFLKGAASYVVTLRRLEAGPRSGIVLVISRPGPPPGQP